MMVVQMKADSAFPQISGSDMRPSLRAVLFATAAALITGPVQADPVLPQGANVTSGSVGIANPGAGQMTITQGSGQAIVNWDGFSIGAGGHVDIVQPSANATILNRVTGDTTSDIHGRLTANGNVHLVNPNGIFIGPNGTVDAGGFVASTLDTSDDDFKAGRLRFEGLGSSAGVENAGRVTITRGGYAAFLGGQVTNSGSVTVPFGRIGFGAGERVTLNLSGDQFLEVAVPSEGNDESRALIEHSGTVSAEGGLIEMKAATARHAARNAINLSGVAEARSVSVQNGAIVLGGGAGGKVRVSGRVTTRSRPAIQVQESLRPQLRGGQVQITGAQIELAGAEIDASGHAGGGLIQIGGDFAGQGDVLRADLLWSDAATFITADALETGQGGRIVLWSEDRTVVASQISARGGDLAGDGGFVEVSSRTDLQFSGMADRRAPYGSWGMLLLDPIDFTIDPGAGGEVALEDNLGGGPVTLDTSSGSGSDLGVITINADIGWTSGTSLTLLADDSVVLNGSLDSGTTGGVSISGPTVTLNGPITTGTLDLDGLVTTSAAGAIEVTEFVLQSGAWRQVLESLPDFTASNAFTVFSSAEFVRAVGGNGDTTPFELVDVYGLAGIDTRPADSYVLADDIDAGVTAGWDNFGFSDTGFLPIFSFQGSLDGAGFRIFDLVVLPEDEGGPFEAGLFDTIAGNASVSNLTLENITVVGYAAGALAADNFGRVTNVNVTSGTVTGNTDVGGLIGENFGLIEDSFSQASVFGEESFGRSAPNNYVGGLVGSNMGTIDRSFATGDVTVNNDAADFIAAGGFVGIEVSAFTVNDSYATGNVSVTNNGGSSSVSAGGFVGDTSGGAINQSYSTGTVAATTNGGLSIGGFSGTSGALGSGNFWDTTTSGQAASPFGTGVTTAQLQDTEAFIALAESEGWDFLNVWAPGDTGFYPVLYSTTPVILATPVDVPGVQYGQTGSAVTTGSVAGGPSLYLGDVAGDTLDVSTLFQSLVFNGELVGTQTFNLATTSLTSANSINYRVVDRLGNATVTPAPLTLTVNDLTKIYGAAVTFGGNEFTTTGLVFSDVVNSATLTSLGAAATADVAGSPYAITASNPVGVGLDNYDITIVDGALTVDPAALTITADDLDKIYGVDLPFAGTEFSALGLLNGDVVSSVTLTSLGAAATAEVAGSPYAITASNAVGTGVANYDITFVDGALTVDPAALTITADDLDKIYGVDLPFAGTEFSALGLVNDDVVTSVTLTSLGAAATADVAGSPYAITASNAVGTGVANYDITFVDGALTVDSAALTITADDLDKIYGVDLPFAGTEFSALGLLNGDVVSSVTLTSLGAAATAEVAGSPYTITASNAVGTGVANYDITFVDGSLTVDPAALTITADDLDKVYGVELTLLGTEFTALGLQNSDSVTGVTLASLGAVATAGVAGSPYDITISDVVGVGLANYDVTLVDGALTVDPAALTITADDQTKDEGETFVFAGTEFSVTGLLNADSVALVTLLSDGAAATAPAAGSPFAITASDPTGSGLDNYDISFADGSLEVVGAPDAEEEIPVPPPFIGLPPPNPDDTLVLAGLPGLDDGDDAEVVATTPTVAETAPAALAEAEETLSEVENISGGLVAQSSSCEQGSGNVNRYLACLADSLDQFAGQLDDIATDLPPGMQNVARIVQDARVQVDEARTRAQRRLATATTDAQRDAIRRDAVAESQQALATASSEIRKAISLVRVEDPELANVQRATITQVAAAVDTAGISLARATGL